MREHKKPKSALSKKEKKQMKMNESGLKMIKGGHGQGSNGAPPANNGSGKAAA